MIVEIYHREVSDAVAGTFSADVGTPETGGGRNPLETADYQAQLAKSRATLEALGQ